MEPGERQTDTLQVLGNTCTHDQLIRDIFFRMTGTQHDTTRLRTSGWARFTDWVILHRTLDLYKSHSFNDEHVSTHPSSYSLTHLSMYNLFDDGQQRKVDESLLLARNAPDHYSTG